MTRYYDKNGKPTPWLSDEPTQKELERCSIDQLLMIIQKKQRKKSFKKVLIDFLLQ